MHLHISNKIGIGSRQRCFNIRIIARVEQPICASVLLVIFCRSLLDCKLVKGTGNLNKRPHKDVRGVILLLIIVLQNIFPRCCNVQTCLKTRALRILQLCLLNHHKLHDFNFHHVHTYLFNKLLFAKILK